MISIKSLRIDLFKITDIDTFLQSDHVYLRTVVCSGFGAHGDLQTPYRFSGTRGIRVMAKATLPACNPPAVFVEQ